MMKSSAPTFNTVRSDCDLPVVDLGAAPLPTKKTLKRRASVPAQLLRFVSYNVRIMRFVLGDKH